MTNRFKATYKESQLGSGIWAIDAEGWLWFKNLLNETVDTPVTANWVKTTTFWGSSWIRLHEFAQGRRFTRWGDLFG